jgi:hypothetical protein
MFKSNVKFQLHAEWRGGSRQAPLHIACCLSSWLCYEPQAVVLLILDLKGEVGVYLVAGVVWSWSSLCGLVQARSSPSVY